MEPTQARSPQANSKPSSKSAPKLGNEAIIADWFLANSAAQSQGKFPGVPADITNFLNYLWPEQMEYSSPLNPVFLLECQDVDQLLEKPVWSSRDGLIPMLSFFRGNSPPEGFASQLLVHEDLGPFVPPEWRDQVGTYRAESLLPESSPRPTKLLLTGVMVDTYCSIRHLEEMLDQLREKVGPKRLASLQKMAFIPPRNEGYGAEHRHEYSGSYVSLLCRKLGTDIQFLDWRTLDGIQDFRDTSFVDFNEQLLIADSYLPHLALSRGGRPLLPVPRDRRLDSGKQSMFVQLGPYHGVRIRKRLSGRYVLHEHESSLQENAEYLSRLSEALRSEANRRFPWPSWCVPMTRAAVEATKRK